MGRIYCVGLVVAAVVLIRSDLVGDETNLDDTASLDAQLADALADELLGEPDDSDGPAVSDPSTTKGNGQPQPNQPDQQLLDQQLLDQLGEDLGAGDDTTDDPVRRIGERMRSAQQLIAQRDVSGRASALQREALQELDALIAQLRRRRQNSQSQSDARQQSIRSKVNPQGKRPGGQKPGGKTSRQPAKDSTTRLGQAEAAQVDMDQMQDLFDQLWGHLPQRAREQMQQLQPDAFLPEFELDIERYFRRLAEDPQLDDRPRRRP